jgi:hypothetical protein
MFISARLISPSARFETFIPTGRICEKTDCVDFTKKKLIDMFPFRLKWTKSNTLHGDKVVWLQAVRWLPFAFIISVGTFTSIFRVNDFNVTLNPNHPED